jgi:hypothetical protein
MSRLRTRSKPLGGANVPLPFGGTPPPSLYSKTRASTIVPDVKFVNAALQSEISRISRASLMEHSKSTLL